MELIYVNDITPELIEKIEWEKTELKFANLTRERIQDQGVEYRKQLNLVKELDLRCQLKALWLYNNSEYTKQEIRQLFGVDIHTLNRWLKPAHKGLEI